MKLKLYEVFEKLAKNEIVEGSKLVIDKTPNGRLTFKYYNGIFKMGEMYPLFNYPFLLKTEFLNKTVELISPSYYFLRLPWSDYVLHYKKDVSTLDEPIEFEMIDIDKLEVGKHLFTTSELEHNDYLATYKRLFDWSTYPPSYLNKDK